LRDYQTAYQDFSLEKTGTRNFACEPHRRAQRLIECCDKEAADSRVALNWIGRDAALETLSFAEFQDASARFANLLRSYGVGHGDTVGVVG
jgi:acetyl-CoA synthetase